MVKQIKNILFKPDPTIVMVKGFPHKGPCLFTPIEDLTIDTKDGSRYERSEKRDEIFL